MNIDLCAFVCTWIYKMQVKLNNIFMKKCKGNSSIISSCNFNKAKLFKITKISENMTWKWGWRKLVLIYGNRPNSSLHRILSACMGGRGLFIWGNSEHEKVICIVTIISKLSHRTSPHLNNKSLKLDLIKNTLKCQTLAYVILKRKCKILSQTLKLFWCFATWKNVYSFNRHSVR